MSNDMNSDERALRDLLDSSMSGVVAPGDAETRARTGGRVLRTRRRAGIAALGVAAALVVAVPVAVSAGGASERPADDTPVAADPSKEVDPMPHPEWWTMPAGEMAQTLSALLPPGVTLSDPELVNTDPAPGEPVKEPAGYLVATLTGPHGPGKVNVVLTEAQPDNEFLVESEGGVPSKAADPDVADPDAAQPDDDATATLTGPVGNERYSCDPMWVNEPDTCTVIKDAEGTIIGQVIDMTVGDVRDLGITLVTPDGGTVMVDIANTLDDKWPHGATASADRLPLTQSQLRAIAEDPAWTSYRP